MLDVLISIVIIYLVLTFLPTFLILGIGALVILVPVGILVVASILVGTIILNYWELILITVVVYTFLKSYIDYFTHLRH